MLGQHRNSRNVDRTSVVKYFTGHGVQKYYIPVSFYETLELKMTEILTDQPL